MGGILEYYLSGGKIKIGKRELIFELLRKDSILRALLGYDGGDLNSLLAKADITNLQGGMVLINFSGRGRTKLGGDPAPLVEELKTRYAISGALNFHVVYTTFNTTMELEINLGEMMNSP